MNLPGQTLQIVLYDNTPHYERLEHLTPCQGEGCQHRTHFAIHHVKLPGAPARFAPYREIALCPRCLKTQLGIGRRERKELWPLRILQSVRLLEQRIVSQRVA